MLDLLTRTDRGRMGGDLEITEDGDIILTNSVLQNAKVRILWILDEWRLGPDLGMPWYEDIWVKNPNLDLIKQDIRSTIQEIDEVASAEVDITEYNPQTRRMTVEFTLTTDRETYSEEVTIGG